VSFDIVQIPIHGKVCTKRQIRIQEVANRHHENSHLYCTYFERFSVEAMQNSRGKAAAVAAKMSYVISIHIG